MPLPRIMPGARQNVDVHTTFENVNEAFDELIYTLRFQSFSVAAAGVEVFFERPQEWTFGDIVASIYLVANNESLADFSIRTMAVGDTASTSQAASTPTTAANNQLKLLQVTAVDKDISEEDLVGIKIDPTNAIECLAAVLKFEPKPGGNP